MVLYTSGWNYDSVGSDESILEVLNYIWSKVRDISSITEKFITKTIFAKSSLINIIIKGDISAEVAVELVTFLIFMYTDAGCYKIFRLECAICHHWEYIDNVMRQAISSEKSCLSVEIHLKLTTGHLSDTIVYCLVSI